LRVVALSRKNPWFAGFDAGGERAAILYSLLCTAKLDNIIPEEPLCDALTRIADSPSTTSTNSRP
jgi:transposase